MPPQPYLRAAHAIWRLLPPRLRRHAFSAAAAAIARKPDRTPPGASNGVVIAGDTASPNGLAESARILHSVLSANGLARGFVPLGLPPDVPASRAPAPADAALLAVVNAPILPASLLRLPRGFIAGRRVIGFWAWELPCVPKTWEHGAKFVHEIWAPSPFTAGALERLAPGRVRVVPLPLAAADLCMSGTRAGFGLPEDRIIVLTVINLASSMVRKNPLGAIAAFKAAFGESRGHLFVLKLSGTEDYPKDVAQIREAIGKAKNIRLIAATFPDAQLRGLIAACDIILSLHRAEGFGLILATAMLLNRPVIATGWSGNIAYMKKGCAALIAYLLVPATDPRGSYQMPHARWAEPDIEDAAARLRELSESPAKRMAMAQAGQAYAREMLGTAPLLAALAANGIR